MSVLGKVWTWRDPLRGLLHDLYKIVDPRDNQRLISYETGCGIKVTVDDVTKKSIAREGPTCLACLVYDRHAPVVERKR